MGIYWVGANFDFFRNFLVIIVKNG
jgi:hypothetical protein